MPRALSNRSGPFAAAIRADALALDERGPFRLRAVMRGDANAIAPFLRESDLLDIAATAYRQPHEAILVSLASSDRAFAIDFESQCAAVCGTTYRRDLNRTYIWLIGSERFDRGLKAGGRRLCRPWFDLIAGDASSLFTVLPEANRRDRRFLEWLGFKEEARIENFRGLGHSCLRMALHRGPLAQPVAAPIVSSAAEPRARDEKVGPATRAAQATNDIVRDSAFEPMQNLASMFVPARFEAQSDQFDRLLAEQRPRWSPWDESLDFSDAFDVETRPMFDERLILALQTPHVAKALESSQRARFVNRTMHHFFSFMLYSEQAAVSICSSLCLALANPKSAAFAAEQARDEARHAALLARFIAARWGEPSECLPEQRLFLAELIQAPEVYKKIVGLQVVIETLALSAYSMLHDGAHDPLARRVMQLLVADEVTHHRFGELWHRGTLPRLSEAELATVHQWCARTFLAQMANAMAPAAQRNLYAEFGLDPERTQQETSLLTMQRLKERAELGLGAVFRDTARALRKSGMVGEKTLGVFASMFDLSPDDALDRAREIAREAAQGSVSSHEGQDRGGGEHPPAS